MSIKGFSLYNLALHKTLGAVIFANEPNNPSNSLNALHTT